MDKQISRSVLGYCDLLSATSVRGWAYTPGSPDKALVMEVLVDGNFICSVTCDLERQDPTNSGYLTRNVGFYVAIPLELQDGFDHVLEFRGLDGSPISLHDASGPRVSWLIPKADNRPPPDRSEDIIFGSLDPIVDGRVCGWAYAKAADVPVALDVFVDEVFQFSVLCDQERADVAAAGHPRSNVGFTARLPARYFDGDWHVLEIRSKHGDRRRFETTQGEGGARQTFSLRDSCIVGLVDGLRNGAVRGWVFRHDRASDVKVGGLRVLVTMQGHPIAEITARATRTDVAAAHDCDPNCGFSFHPPAQIVAGRTVEFDFRVIPGGHVIAGSPARVSFPSLETVAALRDLHEAADKIFADLWLLRDRLRQMAPAETHTVEYYHPWACQYQAALTAAPNRLDGLLPANGSPPLVSIICPAYRPRLTDFIAAIESVRAQTYPHWELIVVDDASRSARLTGYLAALRNQDKRVKLVSLKTNRGISEATNAALLRAKGRYVAFLDHDDLLADRAIEFMLAAALQTGAQMLYSDEDKIDDDGVYSEVNLKPDWNYRLLLAQNYVCHLLFVEKAALDKAGTFRKVCDGAQDHDMVLRLSEVIPHHKIVHVPEVLYHWRKAPASTASSGDSKTYAVAAGVKAIQDHLDRRGLPGRAHSPRAVTCFAIDWEIAKEPTVTIIIPYREHVDMTRACLEALWANTDYANYQIVLVDNWSVSDAALSFASEMNDRDNVSVMRLQEPFNYSRLNNLAVAASRSELLLFMNNDILVSDPAWLRAMVGEMLADPLVGIVGNKLLYPDGLVQHGGVILGVGGVADHAHKRLPADDPGYVARAICAQDISAVTAACMLCRRTVFEALGGFDEEHLQVAYNDVDLCLKAGRAGYRIIWTPSSVAEHRESLSRGDDMQPERRVRFFSENATMNDRWSDVLSSDRFYHRAFSRSSGIFHDLGTASLFHGDYVHLVKNSAKPLPLRKFEPIERSLDNVQPLFGTKGR